MGECRESVSVTGRSSASGLKRALDWRKLLSLAAPEAALQEIASWLCPAGDHEFVLEFSPQATGPDEGHPRGARAFGPQTSASLVRGNPDWRLAAARLDGGEVRPELVEQARSALEAWRAARDKLARTTDRLEARTRELDLLQELGRSSAEAQTPEELFRTAAGLLQRRADLDLVLIVHVLERSRTEACAFLARPIADHDLEHLAHQAAEVLGGPDGELIRVRRYHLDEYDGEQGCRQSFREADLVRLPLLRGRTAIASLTILPAGRVAEGQRRVFFGAANQLSLHLDRILTVREAEQGRFRAILDSMPQAVFLTDRELSIVQANRAAEEMRPELGLPDTGGVLERVGRLEIRTLAQDVMRGTVPMAGGEAHSGDDRVWSVTVSAVDGGGRSPAGLVLVLADVTESRRLQEQLAQAEKMSSLGQIISGIAHELNNPLASILGYAQLVRSTAADEKLIQRLDVLHQQATRCQKIVQNLLSFARGHEPERKPLSLNEVVGSVLSLMSYQLRVDDIKVVTELDRNLPPTLGDGHQLQQALVNLLTNAQHALRERLQGGTIRVRTSGGTAGWATLEVEDDGPGIPESVRSRIFDPFFSTKEVGKGTGLGLSLVYGIVTSHGGTISVDSQEGQGATFRVALPVEEFSATDVAAEGVAAAPEPGVQPGRILVVDDEVSIARLICDALAADGHQAHPVANGREALECLEREAFDLIVSDLKMPVMGGKRLYEEIERRRPGLSDRLLLTTGDTVSREPEELARRAGLELLRKPFDLDDLRRTVRKRLAGRKEP